MAESDDMLLTPDGAAKLRAELEELRGPRRRALAKRLRFAIQQGDLTENADYIAAKEEQAFLEGRIQEIENLLRQATIVEKPESNEEVHIGSTIVVSQNGGPQQTFQLVGLAEAAPRQGKISHQSPIGQALIGRRVGDVATAQTPAGEIELEILEIR